MQHRKMQKSGNVRVEKLANKNMAGYGTIWMNIFGTSMIRIKDPFEEMFSDTGGQRALSSTGYKCIRTCIQVWKQLWSSRPQVLDPWAT